MKKCFKCEVVKSLDDYYKHKQMADGHLNKCKDCTKRDVVERTYGLSKDPLFVEKERKRSREKYYRLGYKDIYKPNPEKKKETIRRYKEKYPEKLAAIHLSQRVQVATGNERHHWCYSFQFARDIIELSPTDHAFIHRYIIYDQDYFMYRRSDTNELLSTREMHEAFIMECIKKAA